MSSEETQQERGRGSRKRQRGRITLPEKRRDFLRALLLNKYQGHDGFLTEYFGLLWRYERLMEALPRVTDPPVGLGASRHPEEAWAALCDLIRKRPGLTHLSQYLDDTGALCKRWGLDCPWAAPWVHAASLRWANRYMAHQDFMLVADQLPPEMVAFALKRAAQSGLPAPRRLPWLDSTLRRFTKREIESFVPVDLVPDYFRDTGTIADAEASWRYEYLRERHLVGQDHGETSIAVGPVEYDPSYGQSRSEVERRILEEARRQMDEIESQHVEAGFAREDTEPELARNVRWLFKRIAVKKPPRQIASETGYAQATVEKAVGRLARELGIRLPRNRGPTVRR